MTDQFSDADCLALAGRSPAAVAVHDKSAWLSLFARHNRVEDPVGSAPHVSAAPDPTAGQPGIDPCRSAAEGSADRGGAR